MKNSYQTLGRIHELSGAYSYENGRIEAIQPMRISDTFPKNNKR